jgi:hypothetical protein
VSASKSCQVHTLFGQLCLFPSTSACFQEIKNFSSTVHILGDTFLSRKHKAYSIRLEWKTGDEVPTQHTSKFMVYRDGEWIGNTTLNSFLDKEVKVQRETKKIKYKVVASNSLFDVNEGVEHDVDLE